MNDTLRVEEGLGMTVDRLGEAIAFASLAHRGQTYRGYNGRPDVPYIAHPVRVMDAVSWRAKLVAVLHDCLEDAGELPDWLHGGERAALLVLTRVKDQETYEEYIEEIAAARGTWADIAREVKIADLRDNLAHDPPPHLRERYEAALARLSTVAPTTTAPAAALPIREGERALGVSDALTTLMHAGLATDEIRDTLLARLAALRTDPLKETSTSPAHALVDGWQDATRAAAAQMERELTEDRADYDAGPQL